MSANSVTDASLKRLAIRGRLEAVGATRIVQIGAFLGNTTCLLKDVVKPRGGYVAVIDPMSWASELLRCGPMKKVCGQFPSAVARTEEVFSGLSYERTFWRNAGWDDSVVLYRTLSSDPALLASEDPRLHDLDAVFIDGDHCPAGTCHDLLRWGSRVHAGGVIVVHDATERFQGLRRAVTDSWPPVAVEYGLPPAASICSVRVLRPRHLAARALAAE